MNRLFLQINGTEKELEGPRNTVNSSFTKDKDNLMKKRGFPTNGSAATIYPHAKNMKFRCQP